METRVFAMAPQTSEQMLRLWYAKLWAPTVDLIGDIAGKEPFIIHGESLIRHCLEESPADFQGMMKDITLGVYRSSHLTFGRWISVVARRVFR